MPAARQSSTTLTGTRVPVMRAWPCTTPGSARHLRPGLFPVGRPPGAAAGRGGLGGGQGPGAECPPAPRGSRAPAGGARRRHGCRPARRRQPAGYRRPGQRGCRGTPPRLSAGPPSRIPPSLVALRDRSAAMMPSVDIGELILEVMSWQPRFLQASSHAVAGARATRMRNTPAPTVRSQVLLGESPGLAEAVDDGPPASSRSSEDQAETFLMLVALAPTVAPL